MGRCFTSGNGSSTVEYVVLLAAGVLVASLLFAALSDGSIQQELKRKVMQALNGEQIATNSGQAPPDSGNKQENQASNHASPSPAPKEAGFFGGLWDAGGKLLDDTGQWFKDIMKKTSKGSGMIHGTTFSKRSAGKGSRIPGIRHGTTRVNISKTPGRIPLRAGISFGTIPSSTPPKLFLTGINLRNPGAAKMKTATKFRS